MNPTATRRAWAAWCLALICAIAPSITLAERLLLVSDLNGRYGSTGYHDRVASAAEVIVQHRPDLVVSTGDMVAGQSPKGLEDATRKAMWSAFNETFAAPLLAAGIPLAITVGNHDGSAFPGFEADRAWFESHWNEFGPPPGLLPGSEWPWRYALREEGLLMITFDGTRPGRVPEREREFVAQMLERHGAEAEWTLVFSHLPFWPLARRRESEVIDDPAFLASLHEAGVDAYASGHHHLYYAGVDAAGMLHLSVGALGGNARAFAGGGERQPHGFAELERQGDTLTVKGWIAPGFTDVVDPGDLPETVSSGAGLLRRVEAPVPLRN